MNKRFNTGERSTQIYPDGNFSESREAGLEGRDVVWGVLLACSGEDWKPIRVEPKVGSIAPLSTACLLP